MMNSQKDYLLIESSSLRKEMCNDQNLYVLERAGQLITLCNDGWTTVEYASRFFEIPIETVRQIIKSHRDEFADDGYKVLSGKDFREVFRIPLKSKARFIAVFPRRAVLRMAMLIRDSLIAKKIRTYLLNQEEKESPSFDKSYHLIQMVEQLTEQASLLVGHWQSISKNSKQLNKHTKLLAQNTEQLIAQSRLVKAAIYEIYENKEKIKKLEQQIQYLQIQKPLQLNAIISEDQVVILRNMVKEIGDYAQIWKKFRAHFGLKKYCLLPKSRYVEAIKWLNKEFPVK